MPSGGVSIAKGGQKTSAALGSDFLETIFRRCNVLDNFSGELIEVIHFINDILENPVLTLLQFSDAYPEDKGEKGIV